MRRVRVAVRVEGVVQGVGFRPFVHQLAGRLGLDGFVGNDVEGVFAEVEGDVQAVDAFVSALTEESPPLAIVDDVHVETRPVEGQPGFAIVASPAGGQAATLISADSATCEDCLRELDDPGDRRFRYPFINCTNCGPRFTIVRGVPYDRPLTTMAPFTMCADCKHEYDDPADRRFHAQPVCCPACGPTLRFEPGNGDPIRAAVEALKAGSVVAIKGLGGYHLAVDATNELAAAELRSRKHREDKPFAVMVPDLPAARELAEVDDVAEQVLTGRRRPIVLLPRKGTLARAVAPGNRRIGVMLPYTPLHHLLLRETGSIVLTSANVSDEPIVYRDEELSRLEGIADAFLTHDRAIHIRTDDSVVRTFRGKAQLQRRSRGYAPEPVALKTPVPHILGCGAELKNTFCLAKGRHAFLSHHIGDLENYETLRSFTEGIAHFRELFDIDPVLVAHDLHPEYLSTKYALDLDVDLVGVQHHHAHIASCLADNGEAGPVIGVAFDGTGFGPDGTIWGGEFLLADLESYERVGHLAAVPMPGGAQAIRQPWRMAASYLDEIGLPAPGWEEVVALKRSGLNSPLTSSAGRLFDAAAALLGVRETINYEGQAAIELEQLADPAERSAYKAEISNDNIISGADLIQSLVDDPSPKAIRAARFHNGVADLIARTCERLRDRSTTVALSGGVFQNVLLLDRTVEILEQQGFRVLTHHRVPTNDGGISLGQVVVAAAQRA